MAFGDTIHAFESVASIVPPPVPNIVSLPVGAMLSIVTTLASAGAILWRLAKRDQQFVSIIDRVGEFEGGYMPRSEFKMYCESQQDAIKSLVSNFNSRMDTLDSHIQDVYRQNRPNAK